MTNLLLVEDHPIFAEALLLVLAKTVDLKVVKVVDTAEKALQLLSNLDLDLLLVDVSLPKMNGIDLVAQLRKLYPHLPCLLISGHMSSSYVKRGLDAGARGYALKDSAVGIIEGIYQILRGEIYISKELRALTS
jgi:DNA-binding NarL/FixJ family response regulator